MMIQRPTSGRHAEAATLGGGEAVAVTEGAARALLALHLDPFTVELRFAYRPPRFWRVGRQVFLDDAIFGPVTPIEHLAYTPERGLHIRTV